MPVLKQRFGAETRGEVLDRTISEASQKTLQERNLRPAMEPKIELVTFGEGRRIWNSRLPLKFCRRSRPQGSISAPRSSSNASPPMSPTRRSKTRSWPHVAKSVREPEPVAEARAAKMGDTLVIDFDGMVDGERKPGMKGEDHKLELGSKSFIDNFEEQLVGSKVGDKKTIKVTFPASNTSCGGTGR